MDIYLSDGREDLVKEFRAFQEKCRKDKHSAAVDDSPESVIFFLSLSGHLTQKDETVPETLKTPIIKYIINIDNSDVENRLRHHGEKLNEIIKWINKKSK